MKRFFAIICLLSLSVALYAQMAIEEISYVPAPSGYYNNLIIKGDVKIKNLITESFFIRAYSSIIKLAVNLDMSYLFIRDLNVYNQYGAVVMKESTLDNGSFNGLIAEPNEENSRSTDTENDFVVFYMNGGIVSASRLENDHGSNFDFVVNTVYSSSSVPSINISTQDISSSSTTTDVRTKELSIFGMTVPKCPNNYYWQKVKVGGTVYTILACNTTSCSNPAGEEACLQSNPTNCWLGCECKPQSECLGTI